MLLRLLFLAVSFFPALSLGVRVATTSADSAELLIQLGKGKDLVATVVPGVLPTPFEKLPSLGALYFPNVERTFSVSPDFLVVDRSLRQNLFRSAINRLGIQTIDLHITDPESLAAEAKKLLRKIYSTSQSPALSRYEHCLRDLKSLSVKKEFSFLALVWADPPIAFGHATLLSNLLQRFGGRNLVPKNLKHTYPQLSTEWVLNHRPDRVYLITNMPLGVEPYLKQIRNWWREKSPKPTILEANSFSRASFAPIANLGALDLNQPIPGSCREL